MNRLSRRKLISGLGLGAGIYALQSPWSLFFESVTKSLTQKAIAEDMGLSPKRYIFVQQAGAPARWMYDLFLDPYSTGAFVENSYLGTKFVEQSGRYIDVEYSTILRNVAGKTLNLPHLWQTDVPRAGGGTRPMIEMLNHIVCLQGIHTNTPDHPGARQLGFKPQGTSISTTALSADSSISPIPAICAGASDYIFTSSKGKSSVKLVGDELLLNQLLDPFLANDLGVFDTHRDLLNGVVQNSIASLNSFAEGQHPGASVLGKSVNDAESLIRDGFAGFENFWLEGVLRYEDLIARSMQTEIPGINDLPIGKLGSRIGNFDYNLSSESNPVLEEDVRSIITSNTFIPNLAGHLTLAEFVITNDLSRSVTIAPAAMSDLLVNSNLVSMSFDEHVNGKIPSLLVNSVYFVALSAGLLELIDRLKEANVFSETVIHVGSEFNRSPREDGIGSDHGFQAASGAFYSGQFSSPLFLGNLQSFPEPETPYTGTWGYGASVEGLGHPFNLGNLSATLATMLGVPSPTQADISVLDKGLNPLFEETRVV